MLQAELDAKGGETGLREEASRRTLKPAICWGASSSWPLRAICSGLAFPREELGILAHQMMSAFLLGLHKGMVRKGTVKA
jgi:hypothetical protein